MHHPTLRFPTSKSKKKFGGFVGKNIEVEEWRLQAEDSTDTDDETLNQSNSTLNTPSANVRRV
jgi:hypothetical protein